MAEAAVQGSDVAGAVDDDSSPIAAHRLSRPSTLLTSPGRGPLANPRRTRLDADGNPFAA